MKPEILRKLADTISFDKLVPLQEGTFKAFLEEYSENLYLAGGCLRDTILGVPVKDYDLFICRDSIDIKVLEDLNELLNKDKLCDCNDSEYFEADEEVYKASLELNRFNNSANIVAVYKFNEGGKDFDVIVTRSSAIKHIYNFVVGLSQVAIHLSDPNKVMYSNRFEEDVEDRLITIMTNVDGYNVSKYVEKVSNKYPSYTVVDNRVNVEVRDGLRRGVYESI